MKQQLHTNCGYTKLYCFPWAETTFEISIEDLTLVAVVELYATDVNEPDKNALPKRINFKKVSNACIDFFLTDSESTLTYQQY